MHFLFKAALVYFCICVFMYFYQRNLMYFPDKHQPDAVTWNVPGVEIAMVETDDGLRLQGWYFPPYPGKSVLVYFHGNAQNYAYRTPKISPYLEQGYGVLLAGYRGYGGNPGRISESGFYKDARAYFAWLTVSKKIPAQQIVLYGESIGTGVAVQMATEREAAALILESPFSSAVDLARRQYFFLPVGVLMRDQYRNIDKIHKVTVPVLILHGAFDEIIPSSYGRRLFEAANKPKTFVEIPNAGHNNLYENGAALHVLEFLSNINTLNERRL